MQAFQQRKKFGSHAGRSARSLITFLFPFGRLRFRKTILWRKVVPVILPDAGKEIIKRSDTESIPKRETAEDGIKGELSMRHQTVIEDTFSFKASR